MSSWLERFYGCCSSSADWCWWPSNLRKYNPGAASGSDDDDDDALIEQQRQWQQQHGTDRGFDSPNGIAMLSRGKIKYVKSGVVDNQTVGSSRIGIPIIDPLIGQHNNTAASDRRHHHQRQLFTQLHHHARLLVNKNIFHWQQHQQTHQWWDSNTPPSSVDLEWEHEGLMPPLIESGSDDGGGCGVDREDDDDSTDDDDQEKVTTAVASVPNTSDRNGSPVHRSPSPASACHSLEWDSNGDDFLAADCRQLPCYQLRQPISAMYGSQGN